MSFSKKIRFYDRLNVTSNFINLLRSSRNPAESPILIKTAPLDLLERLWKCVSTFFRGEKMTMNLPPEIKHELGEEQSERTLISKTL